MNIATKKSQQAEKDVLKTQENSMGNTVSTKNHGVPFERKNQINVAGSAGNGAEGKQWQPVMSKKARRMAARGTLETKVPVVEVTNNENGKEEQHPDISTHENVEHLAVVPYISPSQKEQEDQHSAEVYFDERLQSYVHPKGYDHYANILDKAGTASGQIGEGSVSYITQRSKKKNNTGSKHCLSTSSQ